MMKAQEKGSCDLQRFSKRMSLQKVSGYRFQVSALFAEACSLPSASLFLQTAVDERTISSPKPLPHRSATLLADVLHHGSTEAVVATDSVSTNAACDNGIAALLRTLGSRRRDERATYPLDTRQKSSRAGPRWAASNTWRIIMHAA